ncbi:hypothetical protein [Mesorhizobium jarvisii]|nr:MULTISPECIES: hypothetical protein [Mesorhizobium]
MVDRRAEAYAQQFAPIFVSRYMDAAKAGRSAEVPAPIRSAVEAYANGTVDRSGVDVNNWVYNSLYQHRVSTGGDVTLPPEYASAGKKAASIAGTVALGVGGALLKSAFGLSKRGLFK